jgi:hypothetical protein
MVQLTGRGWTFVVHAGKKAELKMMNYKGKLPIINSQWTD